MFIEDKLYTNLKSEVKNVNNKLNIIPTPQYVSFIDGESLVISKVWVDPLCGTVTRHALANLSKNVFFSLAEK